MKLTDDTETFAIPVVSAIIERTVKGEKQVLVQTRWKPKDDPKYSGLLELPGGKIRRFENIFSTLKREVKEETGLIVKKIVTQKTKMFGKDGRAFAFEPFCCMQQLNKGVSWIGYVFIVECSGRLKKSGDDTKNVHWVSKKELYKMFKKKPKQFFTLHLGVLDLYFRNS